ncbi:MAG: hypothetical protein H0T05_03135 [Acidobacteria bacterium]|nr:hypothetical protein [Acidobacteriota bacterium]
MPLAPEGFDLFRRVIDVWKIRRYPAEALTLKATAATGCATLRSVARRVS